MWHFYSPLLMAQSTSQHLSRSYTDCSLHSPDHGSFHFPPSPFNQPHSATFCCQPIATLLSNFKTALLSAAVISGPPWLHSPPVPHTQPRGSAHQNQLPTTSRSTRTTKDFYILYFKHCDTSLRSLKNMSLSWLKHILYEHDMTCIVRMLIWHVWCV